MTACAECAETIRQGTTMLEQGTDLKDAVCLCGAVWAWQQTTAGRAWTIRRRVSPLQRMVARVLRRTVWT